MYKQRLSQSAILSLSGLIFHIYCVLGPLFSRLRSVRSNLLYEAKLCPYKHTPRKSADFDEFRLKAVGQPAALLALPPGGRVVGRRLILPTEYGKTNPHAKNQLILTKNVCSPTTARLHCGSSLQYLLDSILQEK